MGSQATFLASQATINRGKLRRISANRQLLGDDVPVVRDAEGS